MLLIAFILCTVSTQLGSHSVNVQIVSILLAKNINDTKIFSLCVCELDLSAENNFSHLQVVIGCILINAY